MSPTPEPEPEHEPRPHRANPRSGQAHRPARKAPRPTHKPARPAPHREPDADDEDNDFIESERVRHPAQAQRAPRRDESSHEVDDLEDYESDDTAYSDDVYEPYEFEDDLDSDEELEDSATEWARWHKARIQSRPRESARAQRKGRVRAGKSVRTTRVGVGLRPSGPRVRLNPELTMRSRCSWIYNRWRSRMRRPNRNTA